MRTAAQSRTSPAIAGSPGDKQTSSPARNPICCRRTRRRSEIAWRCLANTLEIYDCQPQDVYNVHLGQQGRNIRWSRALRTRRCCCADSAPPSCDRQHLSYGGCLEVKREYCQNCSALCCVRQLCTTLCTQIWAVLKFTFSYRVRLVLCVFKANA